MSDDGFDLYARDVRTLTPEQWTELRKCIIARAREEQMRAIRQTVVGARGTIRRLAYRLADMFRRAFGRHFVGRRRLQELHDLSAMDDIELRDIGISRLEIRAAMRSAAKYLSRSR